MIHANINLKAILCHVTDDGNSGAEPYMWTSFFYLDANTLFGRLDKKIVTYTPHADWTTRGVFPDGIRAGDIVDIPASLGNYQVALDPGGADIAMVGTLFALLDQHSTPGDAIRAGHEAFAQAVDEALNDYINSATSLASPTAEQVKKLADQIQGQVKSAIKDKLSFYDVFNNQDNSIGFGYYTLAREELPEAAARPNGSLSFTNRITSTRTILGVPLVNDYEVFGEATIVDDGQPPGEANDQYEVYKSAVEEVKSIESEISNTARMSREAPRERGELFAKLSHLRREVRPLAIERLTDARVAYLRSQDKDFAGSSTFLVDSTLSRTRQSNLNRSQFSVESAVVAPPKLVEGNERSSGE